MTGDFVVGSILGCLIAIMILFADTNIVVAGIAAVIAVIVMIVFLVQNLEVKS